MNPLRTPPTNAGPQIIAPFAVAAVASPAGAAAVLPVKGVR